MLEVVAVAVAVVVVVVVVAVVIGKVGAIVGELLVAGSGELQVFVLVAKALLPPIP